MAVRTPPAFMAGTYTAEAMRAAVGAPLLQDPTSGTYLRPRSGLIPHGPALDAPISQAGSIITVGPFAAVVRGSEANTQWAYELFNETPVSVTIPAAPTSQTRLDRIVARARDATYSGSSSDGDLVLVQGVPASSNSQLPTEPPNSYTIATTSTTGTGTPTVTPVWRYTTAAGGILPARAGTADDGVAPLWAGQYRDLDGRLQRGSGPAGTWVDVAHSGPLAESAAALYAVRDGVENGEVGMGAAAIKVCRWRLRGKMLYVRYVFTWDPAGGWNGKIGEIYTLLPGGLTAQLRGRQHLVGTLTTPANGSYTIPYDWPVTGYAPTAFPPANRVFFGVPRAATDTRLAYARFAYNAATPGEGYPQIPGGYGDGGSLVVQGEIEVA